LLSDDANEWVSCLQTHLPQIQDEDLIAGLYNYTTLFSWRAAADEFIAEIDKKYGALPTSIKVDSILPV
jgi:hypothetical protein